jgi:hypothetical protein
MAKAGVNCLTNLVKPGFAPDLKLQSTAAPGAKTLALSPKTETDLTADYADYTDTNRFTIINALKFCHERFVRSSSNHSLKICEIRGICGFNSGI